MLCILMFVFSGKFLFGRFLKLKKKLKIDDFFSISPSYKVFEKVKYMFPVLHLQLTLFQFPTFTIADTVISELRRVNFEYMGVCYVKIFYFLQNSSKLIFMKRDSCLVVPIKRLLFDRV